MCNGRHRFWNQGRVVRATRFTTRPMYRTSTSSLACRRMRSSGALFISSGHWTRTASPKSFPDLCATPSEMVRWLLSAAAETGCAAAKLRSGSTFAKTIRG